MFRQAESGGTESVFPVAAIAAGVLFRREGELVAVWIAMALGAREPARHRTTRRMAALAWGLDVGAAEREASAVVIEVRDRHVTPARRRVASRALRAQIPAMRIAMAVGALAVGQRSERGGGGRMASDAGDFSMESVEPIRGPLVVEARCGPRRLVVARSAGSEARTVRVPVARSALGPQAEVSALRVGSTGDETVAIGDQIGAVALATAQVRVPAAQGESGLFVVQGLGPPAFPANERELPAVVIAVAGHAVAPPISSVEPELRVQSATDGLVAFQTLLRRDSLSEHVTARALRDPFEGGVGLAQRPGRELGLDGAARDQVHEHEKEESGRWSLA